MSYFHKDSVFWVEVDKIRPNPYQPRKEFDEKGLESLASSIRQYGVLQALVVTRQEISKDDGGLAVEYELISGERRLRAARLSGIKQVPVLIRCGEESDLMKLELAIIENLQREDLNVVERARAFKQLAEKFSLNNTEIAKKVGKSREYVSNTMRILSLPDEMLDALSAGRLFEGHARPLLTLIDRPPEQETLFKEILYRKISVREAERISKKIAKDRVRKPVKVNPEIEALEKEFTESLGTRVNIESKEVGGKISIDYFSNEDLLSLLSVLKLYKKEGNSPMLEAFIQKAEEKENLRRVEMNQEESRRSNSEYSLPDDVNGMKERLEKVNSFLEPIDTQNSTIDETEQKEEAVLGDGGDSNREWIDEDKIVEMERSFKDDNSADIINDSTIESPPSGDLGELGRGYLSDRYDKGVIGGDSRTQSSQRIVSSEVTDEDTFVSEDWSRQNTNSYFNGVEKPTSVDKTFSSEQKRHEDREKDEEKEDDLYSVKNFSI